jgi:transposase, IS30 family
MAYKHLRPEEREVLSQMLAAGASRKSIAAQLGRDRSTISRELRRNGVRGMYLAVDAQQVAERRRRGAQAKRRKLNRPENLSYVQERLRQCWSPDQIAGRSRREFPENPERTCSHQTIYSWLARDDHRRRWIVYLRHYRRKCRRTKSTGHVDRALEKRPAIVNERGRFGDWEGDTIIGSGRHGGALVSLVERKSGYLALLPVPSKHAKKVRQAMCGRLQQLPPELRQTMTLDNGSEFAEYEQLESTLDMEVFFTDPHAPWQKGTNENTNGLTRQFFPKGTDFNQVSRYKVARAENLLNDRPRKRLNYQTPNEVLAQQRNRALQT